ncbi:Uma2 family endonuclease [Verrucomicrobiales bacterium]|nr:Uma2 family endonuclease [Verrucomicrobiales bacterium]
MVQAHCQEHDLFYQFRGNATIRKEGMRGGEPDESYIFEKGKQSIDLAIEIALTSGGIDKLDFYQPMQIPEIWIWENNKLSVFLFENDQYQEHDNSLLLPKLDLKLVEELATSDFLSEVIKGFRSRM